MKIDVSKQTLKNIKGAIKNEQCNSEKLATQDTHDEEEQNKNTTLYVLDTTTQNKHK